MKRSAPRCPERGAVAIIVAIFLSVLFAMAAFAVDMGFRYTRSRMLQAVADAAVYAGMPAMVSNNQTTARANATKVAGANGYSGTNLVVDTSVSKQLSVTVKATVPSFFAGIFGGGPTRALSGTAVGLVTVTPTPALLALGGCSSAGISWSGNGAFQVTGDVESNGPINYSTGGSATQNFNNGVESACGAPSMGSGPITYSGGAPSVGGPFSDPFSAITQASLASYCTVGSLTAYRDIETSDWTYTGSNSIWTLTPGVYCSNGDMNLSGPGTAFIANGVTLITTGHVNVGANNTNTNSSVLTAAAGVPQGLAIYAGASTVGCSGQAINLGSMNLAVTGSIYAPNGCARLSGQQGMSVAGSVVAQSLAIGASGDWTFNANGGATASSWQMLK